MVTTGQLTETRPAATSTSHHRPDIQGLRGVAVLLVVLFHAQVLLPGGHVGVDVFFVISGFVITSMLWRELGSTHRLSLADFYARRVRRILPALAVLIAAVVVMSALAENPLVSQRKTASAGAAAASFLANQYFYATKVGAFDAASRSNPFLHTWSLSVEEQFYLVFPLAMLLAALAARKFRPRGDVRQAVIAIAGFGLLASFAFSLVTTRGGLHTLIDRPARFAHYSSATRAWEFAAGALVALMATKLSRIRRNEALVFGAVGFLLVLGSARAYTETTPFPGTAALVPVFGAVAIIIAGLNPSGGVTRLLSTMPFVKIGDVSYGWYLWHWPAMVFTSSLISSSPGALLTAGVVALIPTYLSYRYVEQPIRLSRAYAGRRAVALAAVCIAVPLVLCLALGASARLISKSSTVASMAQATRLHADELRHCQSNAPIATRPDRCTWHASSSRGVVWLVGDSSAGHFTEPVAAAATKDHYDVRVATSAGCPFADLLLIKNGSPIPPCRRFVADALASLEQAKPALVVLASDTTQYIANRQFQFRDLTTGKVATSATAKARLWATALASVLRRFEDAKVPVVMVDTVPHFGDWELTRCPALRIYVRAASCGTSRDISDIRAQQEPGLAATHAAMKGLANVTEVDFTDDLCSATTCSTNHGAQFLYRDFSHLSVKTALTLTPKFTEVIRGAIPTR